MESTKQKGLAYLPSVVYTEGLLPLLLLNEVLRLRRVCKQLKSICDDHLRKKCPSKTTVQLREDDDELSKFLEFDSTSSIKMPAQNFYVENGINGVNEELNILILSFSERYGAQIKHLSLLRMELPLVSNSTEFHLLQNLTNLSSLSVTGLQVKHDVNDTDRKIVPESLPTCFKNNIKKFEVKQLWLERESDDSIFWETVGLLEKLECFRFPFYIIPTRPRTFHCRILENCCKLIATESSNIKCFDLLNLFHFLERSENSLKSFSELSLQNQIKWKNIPARILAKPLYKTVWMQNAHLIVSMLNFSFQNAEGLSYPNLVSMEFNISKMTHHILPEAEWEPQLPRVLSSLIYPSLRILKVRNVKPIDNKFLSKVWQYLTNLEELSFEPIDSVTSLSSEAFLGDEDETQEPPFLRLLLLRKLSIHIPHPYLEGGSNIIAAFHKAFQLMPLKEFIITSRTKIKSSIFDKDAILALCSPGPFIENIEKFPFRNWSMENVTDDEFRQLGQRFPNNQAL